MFDYGRLLLRWCMIVVFHTVVIPVLPIARSSRVSLQVLEPVIGDSWSGVIALVEAYFKLFSSNSAMSDVGPLFSRGSIADTIMQCLIIWTVGRVILSVLLQLYVYPGRLHHRQLGLRASIHFEAEKASIYIMAVVNAVMMCSRYSTSLTPKSSFDAN